MHVHADIDAAAREVERKRARERHLQVQFGQHIRLGQNIFGRALRDDAPSVHDDDAVGLGGLVHEMGDHDDGHAARVEVFADAHEPCAAARIEHRGRFVQDQDLRIHGKHAGDGDALLLPAGKRGGLAVFETDESDFGQGVSHASSDFGGRDPEVLGAERDVVLHERRHDLVVGILEHHARGRTDEEGGVRIGRVVPVDAHRALIGDEQRVQVLRERGFARSVPAEHADEFAGIHMQADAVERMLRSVVGEYDVCAVDHDCFLARAKLRAEGSGMVLIRVPSPGLS